MRRFGLAAGLAAILLIGLVPGTVSAAPVMTFGYPDSELMLRSNCITGRGPNDAVIHVVWKSASGAVKAITDVSSTFYGRWDYCSASKALAVGDTIRASSGAYARTFTMPRVTLVGSRVGNGSFSGRGLANRTADLYFRSGIFGDYEPLYEVTADAQGLWSLPDAYVMGGINASIYWRTQQGDLLAAHSMVPFVHVTIDRLPVDGGAEGLRAIEVKLRDSATDALRGRLTTTTEDWGYFWHERFESAGVAVKPHIGDRVVSKISPDLDWHIPNIEATADTAADTVSGRCYSTEFVSRFAVVHVFRTGHERGYAHAQLSDTGEFLVDFSGPSDMFFDPANVKHGDRVVIDCYSELGDIVSRNFFVP